MNRNTVLSGIIVGGAAIMAAAAIAVSSGYNPLQEYATVVSVEPAFEATRTPRIVCGDEAIPQCITVFDTRQVDAGFDVTYDIDGVQKIVRMDRNPGSRIPVEDGEVVLSPS